MNEQPKMKIVKKGDRKPSPADYERQHRIALFRNWCEHEFRDIFDEMAEKLGYRKERKAA